VDAELGGPQGVTVYTVGHSTRPFERFAELLEREGVRCIADVRTFPASRRHPQYNAEPLAAALAARGVDYVHLPGLGGRRRPRPDSPNTAWRNEGFRGYADHMATPEFRAALDALVEIAAAQPTAVMCAEAVPWRCHRSLIADALVARGHRALHILDGSTSPHTLTSFAVVEAGEVRYREAGAQEDLFQGGA
jgi:uncharacterized protein (DUF488 family)